MVWFKLRTTRSAGRELTQHKIHGLGLVWQLRHCQRLKLITLHQILGLTPKVQVKLTVDPIHTFVVSAIALDVAQIPKAQTKDQAVYVLS
jgi:hypothetical protein